MADSEARQVVVPMIAYMDGPAAMDWLAATFGFVEVVRMLDEDGSLSHGEMEAFGGAIMIATPAPEYESPRQHRERCERARKWSDVPYVIDGVLVYVPDVDAHLERARRGGATILSEVDEGPNGRLYRAEDLEGHRWMFLQS